MYEGSEVGFHVPAVGDLIAFLPDIIQESEFEGLECWHFKVEKIVRVYGVEQSVCVLMFPVSKTQAEGEDKCKHTAVS